jgi:release factor glutamine methyltransferase
MVAARVAGRPLEHIVGWAEFADLRIAVAPGVFVPRQRTRWLAMLALGAARAALARRPAGPVTAVELCCGAGAVAAVLADRLGDQLLRLAAADIDPAAVRCARANLPGSARVGCGDLYSAVPIELRGAVDVLIANAPYVPTAAIALMPPEARLHEPRIALDGGPDGLAVQRRVIAEAPRWLGPGGVLLIETSQRQAPSTAAAMSAVGLRTWVRRSEDHDGTVVAGRRGRG